MDTESSGAAKALETQKTTERQVMAQVKTAKTNAQMTGRRATVSPLLWELAEGNPSLALKKLESSREGLTDTEVVRRQRIYGKNQVAHEKPPPWWAQFIKAFSSPFILVLLVLAGVSYVTDVYLADEPQAADWKKVIILAAMILVSGAIRFWQEFRSIRATARLKAIVRTTATVSRIQTSHVQTALDTRSRTQVTAFGDLIDRDGRRGISFIYLPVIWCRLTYA